MRVCAGLVLSAALCFAAGASPAAAATYCANPHSKTAVGGACPGPLTTIQGALDLASAHPGPDTVGLNSGFYSDSPNLTYSDRGQTDNAVTITAMPTCGKYGCDLVQVSGGAPSGSLLSFGGGGGADVTVSGFHLSAEHGAVGLRLPPGGHATGVSVWAAEGEVAVRLEGPRQGRRRSAEVRSAPGGAVTLAASAWTSPATASSRTSGCPATSARRCIRAAASTCSPACFRARLA